MGILSGLAKAGIANKAFKEARKPANQARAKQLFTRLTGKGGAAAPATRASRRPATGRR